jgi:hypothetical protein
MQVELQKSRNFSKNFRYSRRIARRLYGKNKNKTSKEGDEKMKKATMMAAGILTAASVAGAMGVVMSSSAKRMAKNTAEAMEKTGKKMRHAVQKMK